MFERLSGEAFLSSQMRVATFGRRSSEILRRLHFGATFPIIMMSDLRQRVYTLGRRSAEIFQVRRCDSQRSGAVRAKVLDALKCDSQ